MNCKKVEVENFPDHDHGLNYQFDNWHPIEQQSKLVLDII